MNYDYNVIYVPNHPYASKSGHVYEHRLIMEKQIGRYLKPEEVVHHKDGNKHHNNPNNLELLSSRADHIYRERGHRKQKTCVDCNTELHLYTKGIRCIKCNHKHQEKIEWPDDIILKSMWETVVHTTLAKQLNVSDNAIKHRLKRRGLI